MHYICLQHTDSISLLKAPNGHLTVTYNHDILHYCSDYNLLLNYHNVVQLCEFLNCAEIMSVSIKVMIIVIRHL